MTSKRRPPPTKTRASTGGSLWPVAAGSLIGAFFALGAWQWRRKTRRLRSRLEATRLAIDPRHYEVEALDGLPAPVQHYFRLALRPGQPVILAVNIEQCGTINLSQSGVRWRPFVADQRVITRRPGFDWNARIRAFPGMSGRVRDAYIAGEGILYASMIGLVRLADVHGTAGGRGEN